VARRTGPAARIYRPAPLFFPVSTGEIQAIYRAGWCRQSRRTQLLPPPGRAVLRLRSSLSPREPLLVLCLIPGARSGGFLQTATNLQRTFLSTTGGRLPAMSQMMRAAQGGPWVCVHWLSWQRPEPWATQAGHPDPRIKKPISGRPGIGAQFQLWIFSYTILARLAKNKLSRLFIAAHPRHNVAPRETTRRHNTPRRRQTGICSCSSGVMRSAR
jgi:hypothetical protein